MTDTPRMSAALAADLKAKGADLERTLRILELVNAENDEKPQQKLRLPDENDTRIEDTSSNRFLSIDAAEAEARIRALSLPLSLLEGGERRGEKLYLGEACLKKIGIHLYPRVAYGVLNGGSATSYADAAKNRALSPEAFELLEGAFQAAAKAAEGAPKGTSSAYFESDGSAGPTFLLLKMRSLLINILEYQKQTGDYTSRPLPFFQMTSKATDTAIRDAYERYRTHPLLIELIQKTGIDPTYGESAIQGLIGALSPQSDGKIRHIFDRAGGKMDCGLALPGGHGENFRILAPIYQKLREQGIRWVYLGNVDNSGYTVDSASIATLALRGADAAFEFSWKTSVDIKGGVLVEMENGQLSTADIGQAISQADLETQERAGKKVLFNCATGLFDLDYLIPNLPFISDNLPIRVSEQNKEAGRYAQAEQTTWELLGLMRKPLIFAVSKERRFVAAKTLMETLLASPLGAQLETAAGIDASVRADSARLRRGFQALLTEEYGFKQGEDGKMQALSFTELEALLQKSAP